MPNSNVSLRDIGLGLAIVYVAVIWREVSRARTESLVELRARRLELLDAPSRHRHAGYRFNYTACLSSDAGAAATTSRGGGKFPDSCVKLRVWDGSDAAVADLDASLDAGRNVRVLDCDVHAPHADEPDLSVTRLRGFLSAAEAQAIVDASADVDSRTVSSQPLSLPPTSPLLPCTVWVDARDATGWNATRNCMSEALPSPPSRDTIGRALRNRWIAATAYHVVPPEEAGRGAAPSLRVAQQSLADTEPNLMTSVVIERIRRLLGDCRSQDSSATTATSSACRRRVLCGSLVRYDRGGVIAPHHDGFAETLLVYLDTTASDGGGETCFAFLPDDATDAASVVAAANRNDRWAAKSGAGVGRSPKCFRPRQGDALWWTNQVRNLDMQHDEIAGVSGFDRWRSPARCGHFMSHYTTPLTQAAPKHILQCRVSAM